MNKSWIRSIFSKTVPKDDISYELNKSKEGIMRLIELTARLDKAEKDVKEHEGFLNIIINSISSPIWVKNTNFRFLFLNEACASVILKSTVAEALNLTDVDFENDALAPACIKSDKSIMRNLKTGRFIEHAQYSDRCIWLDANKSPLIIDSKLVGIVGIAKDITDSVPKEIKDRYTKAESIQIPLDFVYCISSEGKREGDLTRLLETHKKRVSE